MLLGVTSFSIYHIFNIRGLTVSTPANHDCTKDYLYMLYITYIVHEPDQMSVPLLVANAIIPFWKALGVRNEKKCDSQSDSVAFRFYEHF